MQKDYQQESQPDALLKDERTTLQSSLFGTTAGVADPPDTLDASFSLPPHMASLTDQSSLTESTLPYKQELMLRGKSTYTVTCFLSDLKMFGDYVGHETPVGRISKENLTDWLMKLKFGQKQAPAPKTMARRVTFLKNFFSWLAREGVLKEDPSASLVLERPLPPLPELLSAEELQRLLDAGSKDARCQCLIYLTLFAGLKKEEVMALKVRDIDLVDPEVPIVTVHFPAATGKQHRERRLALPSEFTDIFRHYLHDYLISERLFDCTDRNLNYILARAVKAADLHKRVTLQLLRDIYAVHQIRSGTSFEALREKMGLSDEAWLEAKEKYRRLALTKEPEME